MVIWVDGQLIDADVPCILAGDRGLTLGDGLFETIALRQGRVRYLERHLARLCRGAQVLGLPSVEGQAQRAVAELLLASPVEQGVVRLTVTRGSGARGLTPPADPRPTVMATLAPMPTADAPLRAIVARRTRRNEHSPLAGIKSLNMLDNVLARAEAVERGGDEALLVNTAGRIAEAATATLFADLEGVIVTPPQSDGALPGIARALALEAGLAIERPIALEELYRARALALTNSLGVRAVVSLDGVSLPAGDAADLARRLRRTCQA
jgi:branched-chain amino acid aminotransferase